MLAGHPYNKRVNLPERTKGMMNSNREEANPFDRRRGRRKGVGGATLAEYKLICARGLDEGCSQPGGDTSTFTFWTIGCLVEAESRCAASFASSTHILRYCSAQPQLTCGTYERPSAQAREITSSSRSSPTNLGGGCATDLRPTKRLLKLGGRRAPPYEKSWPSGIRKMSNGLRAKKKYLLARVKAIRLRAEMAFLAAGGTRGAFAREWLSAFLEEVCGADTPTAVSDH